MDAIKKTARIAGFMYLGNIITGILAQVVRSVLIVPGNAEATTGNIMASEWLFRIGIVSDLLMVTFFLLMGLFFYELLKSVNKRVAALMLLLNLAGVPLMALNMLNQFAPLLLLSGADYLKVFSTEQLQALAMFFMNLQENGYNIAILSFGFYLLPLGYLVYKSGYIPKVLGILLILSFCGWVLEFTARFLIPQTITVLSPVALAIAVIGEFAFCLWLLIKGVSEKRN